jgi:hypothetical protein
MDNWKIAQLITNEITLGILWVKQEKQGLRQYRPELYTTRAEFNRMLEQQIPNFTL